MAALLTACAPLPPMVQQLKSENRSRIILLVEKGKFQYTVPAAMDAGVGGPPLVALIGALAAVGVQKGLETTNERLTLAAAEKGLSADHRQAFIDDLVKRLNRLGFQVDVIAVDYRSGSIGHDRRFYEPWLGGVPLADGVPVFSLNVDFGSCTFGAVLPCIRYALQEVVVPARDAAGQPIAKVLPAGVNGTIVGAGIPDPVTTPVTRLKYRPVAGTVPQYGKDGLPAEPRRYANVDEAIAQVVEFDASLAKLVPGAVDQLTLSLDAAR